MRGIRTLAAASTIVAALASTGLPTSAQWIVFDPNNYAQNLLSAARALQQINNQITSLQNEAQMLVNQARNLASLPYSSLQELQQSIQQTQQLLAQAQRLASIVEPVRSGPDQRCADTMAEFDCRFAGCHARPSHRREQS
jgi:type IV secretion system protein TrbJ